MAEIYDNDVSAANNNSAPPAGYPENMQYSQVNDSAREQMAVLARYIEALSAITTTGAGNAYILTITQTIIALANGMHFTFKADKANAGAATLQINGLAAVAIVDNRGAALVASDIVVGGIYLVEYDGVAFRLLGSSENAASIKTKYESNADTNEFNDAEQTKLAGIEAGAAADQTGAEIKVLYEGEADTNEFSDAEQTKLAGIEAGAAADQTGAEIKALYEGEANTNEFSDAEQTKLAGIEAGAAADQTNNEIRDAVEAATNSNTFNDADHTKLNGIAAGAMANVQATESVAGVVEIATLAEVVAGSDNSRCVTPANFGNTRYKDSTTFRNTTTVFANDPHLAGFALAADTVYLIEGYLAYSSIVGQIKFRFVFDNAPQNDRVTLIAETNSAVEGDSAGFNTSMPFGDAGVGGVIIRGYVHTHATLASILNLQWAQNVSSGNTTQVELGSHMHVRRLGSA